MIIRAIWSWIDKWRIRRKQNFKYICPACGKGSNEYDDIASCMFEHEYGKEKI